MRRSSAVVRVEGHGVASAVICMALVAVLAACSSGGTVAPATGNAAVAGAKKITPTFTAAELPAVPTRASVSGSPTAVAAALVKATADSVKDTAPGWLAAYHAFGVPVIDWRATTKPADPVGPYWSQVWSVGQISRDPTSFWGTDAVAVLTLGATGVDQQAAAATMLADLRADAASADPARQTFARFIAGKSLANRGADPLAPSTTAAATRWDPATMLLARWVLLREWFAAAAAKLPHTAAYDTSSARVVEMAAWRVPAATPNGNTPCSNFLGSDEATSWGQWVAGKIGGGFPGFDGLIQSMLGAGGTAADKTASELAGKFIGHANLAASLLSLIAELSAVKLDTHFESGSYPLKRHKDASDGETLVLGVELTYDFPAMDQDNPSVCALSAIANAAGIGFTMPTDKAPISGAEVLAAPGKNMPDKIYFGGPNDLKFTVGADGQGTVTVLGHARKKKLPDSAKEAPDEFSIEFSAQPEPVTAQTLLNLMLDGASLSAGIVPAAMDVARTLHYDFDDTFLPFVDYKVSYVVTGGVGPVTVTGTVDDIDKPFTLQVSTPEGATTANYDPVDGKVTGSMTWNGVKLTTKGDFSPLTETKTGYASDGMIFTCIQPVNQCSPIGNAHLIFTQQG